MRGLQCTLYRVHLGLELLLAGVDSSPNHNICEVCLSICLGCIHS